jgi:hypothetical protein
MDYLTVKEAAERWGISSRAVTYHTDFILSVIEEAFQEGAAYSPADADDQWSDRQSCVC